MDVANFKSLLSDLGMPVVDAAAHPSYPWFPRMDVFQCTFGQLQSTFVIGDLMQLDSISSASSIVEVPFESLLDRSQATAVVWKVRMRTGRTLIMWIDLEVDAVVTASGMVYVTDDEAFVPFAEDFAVQRLASTLRVKFDEQLQRIKVGVSQLAERLPDVQTTHITKQLQESFMALTDPVHPT